MIILKEIKIKYIIKDQNIYNRLNIEDYKLLTLKKE